MKTSGRKLNQKLKKLMVEKKFFTKKKQKQKCKTGINTKDDLSLEKSLKFLTLIANFNLVLKANNILYPQIYLNECFYGL